MGVGMSTIIQWTVILAVVGAYFYITKKQQTPAPVAQKTAVARGNILDEVSGNEKKKKPSKNQKKQQKPAAVSTRELQVPIVALESESNDDIPDSPALTEDKGSLQRLAGFKSGQTKSSKQESKPEKKKTDKQASKAALAPAASEIKLTAVPISPSLGAISSTSSTTGADGDIDEPDSVDEENLIDDMLEKTSGPSVMRITPVQDEFTTVTRKKGNQSEKKEGLTPLQKKNQKKNEMKKELKKLEREDQLKRLESHKRDQRLARESEAASKPKKSQSNAASSAWSGSNTPLAGSNGQTALSSSLLDTFDSSNSANSRSGITPSTSDLSDAIPQEFLDEHRAAQRELPPGIENEWVEVKPRQKKKKPAPTESETDSDANQNLTASASSVGQPTKSAATGSTPQPPAQKPKKVFTDQDLKIPDMPVVENTDGWDAHAW
ncbi:hypothetical protein AOL_s00173g378 [Orbilia oligospora ATCC 24927]|uniref:Uncharacterized protein n=1 Tax=Arthrobotrys oligospora (strain ATCC 24927 / CBS 115.81 / DSM 1491) TaxID=756982 RepID=G1XPL0_ARTOA|nr:hypothetical protein AOL_s00173g378 [Orbilia oligospora ATCC 24927]EGX45277.1 hypothetical protein AOL_s00173g378 [Orbilia oligospora ATCC 24927]